MIIMAPPPQEVVLPLVKARRGSWTRNLNAAPLGMYSAPLADPEK